MAEFIPDPLLRYVKREVPVAVTEAGELINKSITVLQQRWVIMNNWARVAEEWRDIPLVDPTK